MPPLPRSVERAGMFRAQRVLRGKLTVVRISVFLYCSSCTESRRLFIGREYDSRDSMGRSLQELCCLASSEARCAVRPVPRFVFVT
jgi:hypothetical protein